MTRSVSGWRRRYSSWVGLGLLILLTFVGAHTVWDLQRTRMLEDYKEQARDDVELIGFFLRDALQRQDYQRIDQLLKAWGQERSNTHILRLTAANGFILGEYLREGPAQDPVNLKETIPYSYQGLATLELSKDRTALNASLERLRLELILGAVAIAVVLWQLVVSSVRQWEKARELREQTTKLDRANSRLREVADEMQRMRFYLKNILDSMPSILVGVDRTGRITQWNISAAKATGVAAKEAVGKHLSELLPWLSPLSDKLSDAVRTGNPVQADRLITRDGEDLRYSEVMIYPLRAIHTEGAVVRVDDISDRIRMEQMMVQTEKMMTVGGLAAGMAHEINNPLSGVLQSCQNIERRLSPELDANQEIAETLGLDLQLLQRFLEQRGILVFLAGIREAAERASRIVADMLSFSRRSTSDFVPVCADEMLEEVVRLAASDYDLKRKYDFKRIDIVRDYSVDLEPIPCDRTEIEQVLLNLVKNAAHAVSGNQDEGLHKITLRTARDGDYARIEVEDNGCGMDDQTLQRVFEPFFTTKPTGVGTGLGLSVSYFIITEQHKGRFSVESTPGVGTCFVIRLPLSDG